MRGLVTFSNLGRYGRFANQIYQIASTIGVAKANDMAYAFPLWHNYDHQTRFGSTEDIEVYKYFKNQLPILSTEWFGKEGAFFTTTQVPWGYHDIKLPDGNNNLEGHMQSEKYFSHCIDEIRHYLTMLDEPSITLDAVALHARRGDYDDKYHPITPLAYFLLALYRVPIDMPIFVFSDDKMFYIQLHDALIKDGRYSVASNLVNATEWDYLRSFAVMKKCRHFIISNSTFSSAAAMLSDAPDKIVVAPTRWFGPSYTGITAKDIYNPEWQVV